MTLFQKVEIFGLVKNLSLIATFLWGEMLVSWPSGRVRLLLQTTTLKQAKKKSWILHVLELSAISCHLNLNKKQEFVNSTGKFVPLCGSVVQNILSVGSRRNMFSSAEECRRVWRCWQERLICSLKRKNRRMLVFSFRKSECMCACICVCGRAEELCDLWPVEVLCLNSGEVCDSVQRGEGNSNKRNALCHSVFRQMQKTSHKTAHLRRHWIKLAF